MVLRVLQMISWCVSYLNKSKQQRTIYVHGIIGTTSDYQTVTYIGLPQGSVLELTSSSFSMYLDNLKEFSDVKENLEF